MSRDNVHTCLGTSFHFRGLGGASGLSVAVAADLLRGRGYSVVDLGANTPPASYAHAAVSQSPVAVVVGVTNSDCAGNLADVVAAIGKVASTPVLAGGPGIDEGGVTAAGAAHVDRLEDLVVKVDSLRDLA